MEWTMSINFKSWLERRKERNPFFRVIINSSKPYKYFYGFFLLVIIWVYVEILHLIIKRDFILFGRIYDSGEEAFLEFSYFFWFCLIFFHVGFIFYFYQVYKDGMNLKKIRGNIK